MPKPRKPDRRVMRTRQLLKNALWDLVIERDDYISLTVQDIVERADIARVTFYMHYTDKEDLLAKALQENYEKRLASLPDFSSDEYIPHNIKRAIHEEIVYLMQNYDFNRVMMSGRGSIVFILQMREYMVELALKQHIRPLQALHSADEMLVDFITNHIASTFVGALTWCLQAEPKPSVEELAELVYQIVLQGVQWVFYPENRLDKFSPE